MRLASYESAVEYAFLNSLFGREGELPNTVFGLLAPDGKTQLTRFGRGPSWLTRSSRSRRGRGSRDARSNRSTPSLAEVLQKHAAEYESAKAIRELPQSLDFRRALNVAACDAQALVVVLAKDQGARDRAVESIQKLCWSDEFVGRFQYAVVADRKELKAVQALPKGDGIMIVRAGAFGVDGKVLAHRALDAKPKALRAMFAQHTGVALAKSDRRTHVRRGTRAGIDWQTAVPVTDGRAADAENRRRRRRR